VIVADSGPLIALARIGQLHLLRDLFGVVVIPHAVATECLAGQNRPGSQVIAQALKQGWLRKKRPTSRISPVDRPALGDGENAAIALARGLGSRLLIDDKLARKAAGLNQVAVVGTAGVLIEAKQKKFVRKVKPLIEDLRRCGYRLSEELVESVLARCGEGR
jgi:predicted nucleic acid-binding protein